MLAWVVAATIAVLVGVAAVTGLGNQIRDRGPMGDNELVRGAEQNNTAPEPRDRDQPLIERTVVEDFGEFVVACQGKYAIGIEARPDEAGGWRTVSYETGPDDDIDAVFSNGRRSQEIETYCNLGRPIVEVENNTIPEDD